MLRARRAALAESWSHFVKSRKHNPRRPMPAGELFDDDLIAADEIFGKGHRKKDDRKLQQLCRQVQRTVSLSLSDCGDDMLRDLLVQSVAPAPDASRLMLTVYAATATPANPIDLADIHARLARVSGRLRHEVAIAITRKRAPELLFCVTGGQEVQP
jgi:ribosome-binding factor A